MSDSAEKKQTLFYAIEQIDSWFFKESRSMDGSGASKLECVFPPSNKTLLGAFRAMIGNKFHAYNKTSWQDYSKESEDTESLKGLIGYGQDDYGSIVATGSFLYKKQDFKEAEEAEQTEQEVDLKEESAIYFPAPLNLISKGDENANEIGFFKLGDAVRTDVGNLKLPELNFKKKQNTLSTAYIQYSEFEKVLNGENPSNIILLEKIIHLDTSLQIRLENDQQEKKLFQIQPLVMKKNWCLLMGLSGINGCYQPNDNQRFKLGGEGRQACLKELTIANILPPCPAVNRDNQPQMLMMYLLTPLLDSRAAGSKQVPLPNSNFTKKNHGDGHNYWEGKIKDIDVSIVSAVVGKLQRSGGWDLVKRHSTPVKSYLPAGSCWYIDVSEKTVDEINSLLQGLHGSSLADGVEKQLGHGLVAMGIFKAQDEKND